MSIQGQQITPTAPIATNGAKHRRGGLWVTLPRSVHSPPQKPVYTEDLEHKSD